MPTYKEYRQSEAWIRSRDRFEQSAKGGSCYCCSTTNPNRGWDAYHKTYKRLGSEHMADLFRCCHMCHKELLRIRRNNDLSIWGAARKLKKNIANKKVIGNRPEQLTRDSGRRAKIKADADRWALIRANEDEDLARRVQREEYRKKVSKTWRDIKP